MGQRFILFLIAAGIWISCVCMDPIVRVVVLITCWLQVTRSNRQNVPSLVSKLAGVQPYSADEIQQEKPLVGMSREELSNIVES